MQFAWKLLTRTYPANFLIRACYGARLCFLHHSWFFFDLSFYRLSCELILAATNRSQKEFSEVPQR